VCVRGEVNAVGLDVHGRAVVFGDHALDAAVGGEDRLQRGLEPLGRVGDNDGRHHEPPCVHVGETRVHDSEGPVNSSQQQKASIE
jgi:hypothetical protein